MAPIKRTLHAAFMLAALPALAESDPETAVTVPVEVSAYRIPLPLEDAVQAVSVLTREALDTQQPASLPQFVQQLPGVYVDQVGRPGGVSNIYIRGSDPEQVLVLIDGVRVNDPTVTRGGAYDLSSIDPASIERVEVLRGPGSALYGADGMGGVVNIVTRPPADTGIHGNVAGGVGGQDYLKGSASVQGGQERFRASLSASHLEDGEASRGGELDLTTFSGSLRITPVDALDLNVYARHSDRDSSSFPDFSGGIRLAVVRELEEREADETVYGVDARLTPWDKVAFNLKLARYEREEDLDTPGVDPFFEVFPTQTHTDFIRDSALISTSLDLPLATRVVVGYEHLDEDGENVGTSLVPLPPTFTPVEVPTDFALERRTDSFFAEAVSRPVTGLVLQLGVRRDDVEDLDAHTSISGGARYTFSQTGTTLKAYYAEGFKAPSFFSLANPLYGNPDLEPEETRTFEVGIDQSFWEKRVTIGLTVFDTRYTNLIDFDANTFTLVNRGKVDAEGAEFTLNVKPLPGLEVGANYTYVSTDILDSSDDLRNRPRNRAALIVRYAFAQSWNLSWVTNYVGEFIDTSIPTGEVEMDDYTRTDAALTYRWKQFDFTIAVDNLFDCDCEQFVGFEDPGRRLRGQVAYRF